MPTTPSIHVVNGTVKFSGSLIPVEGATVSFTHDSNPDDVETNANGEFVTELTDWESGDSLTITATFGNRTKAVTVTLSGSTTTEALIIEVTNNPDYEAQVDLFGNLPEYMIDYDETITVNEKNQPIKTVKDFGHFVKTIHILRDSKGRVTDTNVVITK